MRIVRGLFRRSIRAHLLSNFAKEQETDLRKYAKSGANERT